MLSLRDVYSRLKEAGFFGKRTGARPYLDVALEKIEKQALQERPSLTFVQLPPGYGKTAIPYSLSLWALLSENIYAERSIHVLPLRSIVEDVWSRFVGRREGGLKSFGLSASEAENIAGAQCMFIHGSLFLQKNYVATTIDTFALLATKLPPAELGKIAHRLSLGHYEVARGAIISSTIVFDEVHLLLEEAKEGRREALTALLALIRALFKWRSPAVIMTATLPQSWRQELISWLKEREPDVVVEIISYGEDGVKDEEFEAELESVKLHTDREPDEASYIDRILQATSTYKRVLVVANTVRRARQLYNMLRERGADPLLLHSKFTQGDRESKLRRIEEGKWLCVSTQVVEAGVDISAEALFTDVAPPCALIQRAGRCCRPSHIIERQEGEVVICTSGDAESGLNSVYGTGSLEVAKDFLSGVDGNFNWHSYTTYMPLLERVHGRRKLNLEVDMNYNKHISMLKVILHPYYESSDAFNFLLRLGSLTRDKPLIPGIVCEAGEIDGVSSLSKYMPNYIPLEVDDVKRVAEKGGVKLIIKGNEINEEPLQPAEVHSNKIYERILRGDIVAIRIPPSIYDSERGLLI